MKPEKEARLLRLMAAALASDLAMPYQRLASTVGVSRRTLYRIAPTRDALFERLRQEAVAANAAAIAAAGLTERPFLIALRDLTNEFVGNAALYAFWAADTWGKSSFPTAGSASDAELETYHEQMSRFFQNAQAEGAIREGIPLDWLLAAYDGLLIATTTCRRAEKIESIDLAELLVTTFLRGLQPQRSVPKRLLRRPS